MSNAKIQAILSHAIDENVFPGAVVGMIAEEKQDVLTAGRFRRNSISPMMTDQSIFDVASITKVIPTACLALHYIDTGQLQLETEVHDLLPEFRANFKVTVRDLLRFAVPYRVHLSSLKDEPTETIWQAILEPTFAEPPGRHTVSSNATSIVLGLVVERLTGQSLDRLSGELFFRQLMMTRTSFRPTDFPATEVVPTEIDPWRGREIVQEVHDESAWRLRSRSVGSAGLFSSVPDLLQFINALMTGQLFSNQLMDYIRPGTVSGWQSTLGFETNIPTYMGKAAAKLIGKSGFTGTLFLADLEKRRAFVMLSNCCYPRRPSTRNRINAVRRALADLIFNGD